MKAVILAGAPGAGKGYILRGLDLGGLKVMNVDDIFVPLLKKANVTLDLKNATPEERSEQAKQMAAANKQFKGEMEQIIAGRESFILDGTAASYNKTAELKSELEEAGYDTFMLYVYTDLERSLSQNQDRYVKSGGEDRSLAPAIVMRTWKSVTDNLPKYEELFGDNFVAVANTLDDRMQDIDKIIQKYEKFIVHVIILTIIKIDSYLFCNYYLISNSILPIYAYNFNILITYKIVNIIK